VVRLLTLIDSRSALGKSLHRFTHRNDPGTCHHPNSTRQTTITVRGTRNKSATESATRTFASSLYRLAFGVLQVPDTELTQ